MDAPTLGTLVLLLAVPAPAPQGPTAVLESAAGAVERRPLAELGPRELAGSGAFLVEFEDVPPLPLAPDPAADRDRASVEFSSGDRLFGVVEGGGGDELRLRLVGGARVDLTIDYLASLRLDGRLTPAERASMGPAGEGDRIYWKTSGGLDWDDGTLVELTPEGVEFEGRIGAKVHPWADLAGLFLQDLGFDAEIERGPDTVGADLVDLGRLRGRLVDLDAEACTLEVAGGAHVRLPLGAVAALFRDDGTVVFVSELAPRVEREGSPFDDDLGMRWPPARDRSVTGTPLVVDGRVYSRGIGVHAPSRLVYALDGAYATLRGQVGVDDQVLRLASRGSVEFRVLVDGEERWSSGVLRGGDGARPLGPVDVAGARELVLEVGMATDWHVADRADWLRPLLVRAE